jgi:uncharacterized protein YdeI (BOF family)
MKLKGETILHQISDNKWLGMTVTEVEKGQIAGKILYFECYYFDLREK